MIPLTLPSGINQWSCTFKISKLLKIILTLPSVPNLLFTFSISDITRYYFYFQMYNVLNMSYEYYLINLLIISTMKQFLSLGKTI